MFIADETGNLFPHQHFGLRGQEVTEKSSEKEETKTIVFLCGVFHHTPKDPEQRILWTAFLLKMTPQRNS